MKKTILLLLLTTITFGVYSQESRKGQVNIGFEGGLQFTGIDDVYMPVSNDGTGYILGPNIEYYLSDIVKIKAGLMFDNRAFSLEGAYNQLYINDSTFTSANSYQQIYQDFRVNYLTIPISLIYIKGNKKFRLFIKGTFYYSILLNSSQTGFNEVYIAQQDTHLFIDSDYPDFTTPGVHQLDPSIQKFNSSDMGFNMFFGAEYNITPKVALTLAPCYSFSFGNVWENPNRDVQWTQLYQINLGILYKLK